MKFITLQVIFYHKFNKKNTEKLHLHNVSNLHMPITIRVHLANFRIKEN